MNQVQLNKEDESIVGLHNENPDIDKFKFVKAYINGLSQLAIVFERNAKASPQNTNYQNDFEMGTSLMKNWRLSQDNFNLAKNYLEPFKESQNKIIQNVVNVLDSTYDGMIKLSNESIEGYEKLYGPETLNHPENFNIGKQMKDVSELQAKDEQHMESFFHSTLMIAHVLISEHPDKDGHMSILAITKTQKEELLSSLNSIFGEKIKTGLDNKNLNYFESCGAVLYEVLKKRGFKDSDKIFMKNASK